jgi:DNA modification methylase
VSVKLICGDCLDVLPGLASGSVDAVVTDPPYGIGIARSHRLVVEKGWAAGEWDDVPLDQSAIDLLVGLAPNVIIWGGNYYRMPPTRGYLVWDKDNDGRDFGECEYAWTTLDSVSRIFRYRPQNMDGGKVHPTQKPIALMKWCVEKISRPGDTILDPYMGSGTTGIACAQLGRNFIGIEKDPHYFAIAERRIRAAEAQPALFQVQPHLPPPQVLG